MKGKHLEIPADTVLWKQIRAQVQAGLKQTKGRKYALLWLKALVFGGISLALYIGVLRLEHPIGFLMAFVFYGIFSLLLALNFAHDFAHDTVFKQKRWNRIGFTCLYTLVGAHASAWKQRHIQAHHLAPNVAGFDPDLQLSKLIRVTADSPYYWFHRYQHFYAPLAYMVYSLYWIFFKDVKVLLGKDMFTPRKTALVYLEFGLQKSVYLFYMLILPLWYAHQPWWMVFVGFLFMHVVQSVLLLFTFLMTHHVEATQYPTVQSTGEINSSWLMNQVKSSNDIQPFSRFANFVLGGFNNHIAHHLFPQVHHIYYPELNRILYPILQSHGIKPNQSSFLGGINSHLKLLKQYSQLNH
jgi:linoleoyl-CoA desaturase